MEIYHWLKYALAGMIICGLAVHVLGMLCLSYFRFRKIPKLPPQGPFPGVSIIKPCFSNSDNEENNFNAYFHQDYPGELQVIFVVSNETDPIVPTIRNYLKKYPNRAELVISTTRKAYWMKVDALYDAHQNVKHEMIIWSDSDAIVRSNYVSQMVACLQEPGVSVVTTPQYDAGVNNFATALKVLGNNCDIGVYMMSYNFFIQRKQEGWGHSLGFKRSEFEAFGDKAWYTLGNSFVDDSMLSRLFYNAGKKVVFRNIYCPVQYSNKTLKQMFDQIERFALCQKTLLGFHTLLLGLCLFPVIPAVFLFAIAPQDPFSTELFFLAVGTRIFSSFLFEGLILGPIRTNLRYSWTVPLWDLLHIYFYFHAFFQNTVSYHGRTFRFAGNARLEEIKVQPNQDSQGTKWRQTESNHPSSARSTS